MTATSSLKPIRSDRFGPAQARHLLWRAGFGASRGQVEYLASLGVQRAVDYVVDYQKIDTSRLQAPEFDPDIIRPPDPEKRKAFARARKEKDQAVLAEIRRLRNERRARDRQQAGALSRWWLGRMIETPRPLEEKLTLLWHGHFASNYRTVRDSYLLYRQNELFRTHANGNFADLAYGIIHDPAMIAFLNNNSNRARKPNENLARELMELFTLGVGNYSEQDIKQGARALTGYSFHDNDFVFRRHIHDSGEKTILGQKGTLDGDDFVTILLRQPACARFIAYKLYKHFVADFDGEPAGPAGACIEKLAQVLRANRYELTPTLKVLFKSEHFYDDAVVGHKIKSPVELLIGTIRTLNTPVRELGLLVDAMGMMGQALFNPPSVAGWDGGRSWINTSTLFVRQNVCNYLLTGKLPFEDGWTTQRLEYDPTVLEADLAGRSPGSVVDRLMEVSLEADVAPSRRGQFVEFLTQRKKGVTRDALIGLLLLITASPEYQMC